MIVKKSDYLVMEVKVQVVKNGSCHSVVIDYMSVWLLHYWCSTLHGCTRIRTCRPKRHNLRSDITRIHQQLGSTGFLILHHSVSLLLPSFTTISFTNLKIWQTRLLSFHQASLPPANQEHFSLQSSILFNTWGTWRYDLTSPTTQTLQS